MGPARTRSRSGKPERGMATLPVVVTLDGDDKVVDIVGDLEAFVSAGDSVDAMISRLALLACGEGGLPERLGAVEVSDGRYADVNLFFENDLRHFVLRDVSAAMQALRERQQLDHEAELDQQRMEKAAGKRRDAARGSASPAGDRVFRQGAGLLEMVSSEMRESLLLLTGHVQLLARKLHGDSAALNSVAAMQHAVMRLDALSSNALVGLGELATGKEQRGMISLDRLAGFLQDSFALQAGMRGIALELRIPENTALIEVDDLALRRLLVNLVVHALDGMERGELRVALATKDQHLEIELEAEPSGLSAERFGELVTTVDLLHSNARGSLLLAASQNLLQRLNAAVELVERVEGGHLLWIRIPALAPGVAAAASTPTLDARLVVVSLKDGALARRVVAILQGKGVPAIESHANGRMQALLRSGDLRASVVDDGDESGKAITQPMLIVDADAGEAGRDGWTQVGNRIRVPGSIGDATLEEALDILLADV